jgi:hypothetical protein
MKMTCRVIAHRRSLWEGRGGSAGVTLGAVRNAQKPTCSEFDSGCLKLVWAARNSKRPWPNLKRVDPKSGMWFRTILVDLKYEIACVKSFRAIANSIRPACFSSDLSRIQDRWVGIQIINSKFETLRSQLASDVTLSPPVESADEMNIMSHRRDGRKTNSAEQSNNHTHKGEGDGSIPNERI